MDKKLKRVLKELDNRGALKETEFKLEDFCFDKQLEFIKDESTFKAAYCSRRSGKTVACAADLFDTAMGIPNSNSIYITLNRVSAKRIIWRDLKALVDKYAPTSKIDNSELSFELPNKSMIYLSGAKDQYEIEKYRGMSIIKAYIDESQSFKPYLVDLIEDVLTPAMYDTGGTLALIGTPGPIPAGAFHDACHNLGLMKGYSVHHWTIYDNPWIQKKHIKGWTPEQILQAELKRKGISPDNPTFMREALGLWVKDTDSLVYRYDLDLNTYTSLPEDFKDVKYVIGIDLGYHDADAIAVIGFSQHSQQVFLIEEYIERKNGVSELVARLKPLYDKYKPVKVVMDTAGPGKKIAHEITIRHGMLIEAAEKARKLEYVELLNDDLRTGRFKVPANSEIINDWNMIQWDFFGAVPKISDSFHSDIADAVLYAWRECYHFIQKIVVNAPKPGSAEAIKAMEEEMERELEEKLEREMLEEEDEDF